MKLYITIFLILYSFGLFGQTDSSAIYLEELKKELFKPGDEKIFLYKLIYCSPDDPDWQQIDSTKMVRAAQPDPKIAIDLLRKIMFTKNPKLIKELKVIYDRHMTNFMEEWSQVFLDNYYMCESIKSQFQILSGFEQTLTALNFVSNQNTHEEIFLSYFNNFIILCKISNLNNYAGLKEQMKKYHYFNKNMFTLNPYNPWDFGVKPFSYLDPWQRELKTDFLNFILSCHCFYQNNAPVSDSCNFIISHIDYYENIRDEQLTAYFIQNGKNWVFNRPYLIFTYAAKNFEERLSIFIIDQLIEMSDSLNGLPTKETKEHFFRLLTKGDTRNFPLVLNKLLSLSEKDPEKALALSKLLPYDLMEEYSKNYILMLQKMRDQRNFAPIKYPNKNPIKDGN